MFDKTCVNKKIRGQPSWIHHSEATTNGRWPLSKPGLQMEDFINMEHDVCVCVCLCACVGVHACVRMHGSEHTKCDEGNVCADALGTQMHDI